MGANIVWHVFCCITVAIKIINHEEVNVFGHDSGNAYFMQVE